MITDYHYLREKSLSQLPHTSNRVLSYYLRKMVIKCHCIKTSMGNVQDHKFMRLIIKNPLKALIA